MKSLKKLFAFTVIGIASIFAAKAGRSNGEVAKRVNNVRKELKKKIESGDQESLPNHFFLGSGIKDWVNWGNWGNWNNWANWDNWSKWSKWDNWVNWANRWGNTK